LLPEPFEPDPLDPEELEDDPEELELEELDPEFPDELEPEELGFFMDGAPGSRGAPPHPNRETQRHNKARNFITALRRDA
jgi:hypothetical protein